MGANCTAPVGIAADFDSEPEQIKLNCVKFS